MESVQQLGLFDKKVCAWCCTELKLKSIRDETRKRFCSHACRQRWRYANGGWDMYRMYSKAPRNKPPKHPRICETCGVSYMPRGVTQRWCRDCVPDKSARARLQRYGITDPEWRRMYEKQNGKCALCEKHPTVVDHDHTTGIVRGLLCDYCNLMLAGVESGWYLGAIEYLKKGR